LNKFKENLKFSTKGEIIRNLKELKYFDGRKLNENLRIDDDWHGKIEKEYNDNEHVLVGTV
jgi:hypothetical protein